jgi:hypothetical protein
MLRYTAKKTPSKVYPNASSWELLPRRLVPPSPRSSPLRQPFPSPRSPCSNDSTRLSGLVPLDVFIDSKLVSRQINDISTTNAYPMNDMTRRYVADIGNRYPWPLRGAASAALSGGRPCCFAVLAGRLGCVFAMYSLSILCLSYSLLYPR